MSLTTDPQDPRLGHGTDQEPVSQNEVYLVLSDDELSKGFVRPIRTSYVHLGRKIELKGGVIEPLTEEQLERYKDCNYVAFLRYPKSENPVIGKYLFKEDVENVGKYVGGCGTLTTMNRTIAETYAREPKFYGSTYCMGCMKHLPVEEFVWNGTNEKVGS